MNFLSAAFHTIGNYIFSLSSGIKKAFSGRWNIQWLKDISKVKHKPKLSKPQKASNLASRSAGTVKQKTTATVQSNPQQGRFPVAVPLLAPKGPTVSIPLNPKEFACWLEEEANKRYLDLLNDTDYHNFLLDDRRSTKDPANNFIQVAKKELKLHHKTLRIPKNQLDNLIFKIIFDHYHNGVLKMDKLSLYKMEPQYFLKLADFLEHIDRSAIPQPHKVDDLLVDLRDIVHEIEAKANKFWDS